MYKYLNNIKDPNDIKKLSFEQLNILASEIRDFMLQNVSVTGGHVASNLGMVEITLALLKCFDFDKDKIVFDVGHQCYPYKILTGRKESFDTLRQYKGISGFPKKAESKYDFFDTGHSSNSISVALGMAKARDIKIADYEVVSVIGDGALTGGMAYEALNSLGFLKTKMIIILNDNGMSISGNVGGLSEYLSKIRINKLYNKVRNIVYETFDAKSNIIKLISRAKLSIKSFIMPSMFFDDLGVRYIGPINGHNIKELTGILNKVKDLNEPVVIHTITKKGKGYKFAEEEPDKFHGISPFNVETGEIKDKSNKKTYSDAFSDAMLTIAKANKKVVAITAAMKAGTGLKKFAEEHPNRFFDVGIAEQHAVSFSAGLASEGLKPIFAVYSSFLQRGFDQIIQDVCLQNLPVIFAIDRSGLVGSDGETHQGIFDISFLSMIPNLTILSPKCIAEVEPMLKYALTLNKPVAIRYGRGSDSIPIKPLSKIEEGKWEVVSRGEKVAIIATGRMVQSAMLAKKELLKIKKNPMIINVSSIKPLDTVIIKKLVREKYNVVTIEENTSIGGLGNMVLKCMNNGGYKGKFRVMAFKDKFIEHGTIKELLKQEKMDVDSIVKAINKLYR